MSSYTKELGEKIANLLAEGKTLAAITAIDGMPHRGTIHRWATQHPDFGERIREARLEHADALADEVVHISDTEVDAQRARNRIEARKWRAGTIKPKEYGNKIDVALSHSIDPAQLHREAMLRLDLMRGGAPALIPETVNGETVLVPADSAPEPDLKPEKLFP